MAEKKEKRYVSDNAQLMAEWNREKNDELNLNPEKITVGSGKKAWWKCRKGHEWQARIAHINSGSGCPYCSGRYAIEGCNDLQTINPYLAKEWNYEKNGELKPEKFTANSSEKVWWKCHMGHEWQAKIERRNKGCGCPICNSEKNSSFPEFAIVYYLEKYGLDVVHSYKEKGYELDVYIPSKNIGIEYDGWFWHKNRAEKDLAKNAMCKKDGVKLYRIREDLFPLNDSSIDFVIKKDQEDLSEIARAVLSEIIGTNVDIDIKRDAIAIENLRKYTQKETSLLNSNALLAEEWNFEKNGILKPEYFTANSGKKVWWKCKRGHEWNATINSRSRGRGCPYCSGRYAVEGYNDLQTINPYLAKEWNFEKNGELNPEKFTANSEKKVWWKCHVGHEWQARIANRNKGRGCPYCSGRKVLQGYNDLQTVNPSLAEEWDYGKNEELKPEYFAPNSNKKVWWKCSKGHEWQTTIQNRNNGNGCPYCSGRYAIKNETDLQTVNPTLANEWNYEKNRGLTPTEVLPNSNKKVWWKCNKGHEWQSTINHRNNGRGCPYCSGRKKH